MLRRIDHIVILVRQLERAIESYRGLGFQVLPGGEHPGGTHNALVTFQDGSYLELIAFQQPDQPSEHRWHRFLASGGGLVDFALGADNVAETIEQARAAGLPYNGPVPGARRRPDGQELSWRLGTPSSDRTGELPFLIDDVTPRELRVPGGDAAVHPNGVTGLRKILVAVRDIVESAELYGKLLGVAPPPVVIDKIMTMDTPTSTFAVGSQQIVLTYPSSPSSPIATRIQQQGDGPLAFVLAADGIDAPVRFTPEQAEGARILLEPAG